MIITVESNPVYTFPLRQNISWELNEFSDCFLPKIKYECNSAHIIRGLVMRTTNSGFDTRDVCINWKQNTWHGEESYTALYCTRQNNEPWTTSAALFSVSELSSQHKERGRDVGLYCAPFTFTHTHLTNRHCTIINEQAARTYGNDY